MPLPLILPTQRESVTLRQLELRDAEPFYSMVRKNRAEITNSGSPTAIMLNRLSTVRAYINNSSLLRMAILDDEVMVGLAGLTPAPYQKSTEIGCFVDKDHYRNNYATLAVQALCGYGLERYGRVTATISEDNLASLQLVQRAGFTRTAQSAGILAFELVSPDK